MKWILFLILTLNLAYGETSKVIPAFLEAAEIYQTQDKDNLNLRPEIYSVLQVFKQHQIDPELIQNFSLTKKNWALPKSDKFDSWIENKKDLKQISPIEVSLQATKVDVHTASQFSDDVYAYFFITDGVIPTGKVTSIYKGVASGESFFFNPIDRSIFPLVGIPAKSPTNHLIVDYGIIESDGDDITKLQKLSSIIIDIAIAVYTSQSPETGQVIVNLRKEIKALADLLISQNSDDRLATGTFGLQTTEIESMLANKTYVEFKKNHKNNSTFFGWDYDIHFRLVR